MTNVVANFHDNRLKGIGGSDAAAALGLCPYKTPMELYGEKRGLIAPFEGNVHTEFGNRFEDLVADWAAELMGRKVRRAKQQRVHKKHEFMRCHLDRYVYDDERGRGVMQVKTAGGYLKKNWQEEPPVNYQIQLQHEMEVVGAEWGCLVALFPDKEIKWCDLEPHEVLVERMIEGEAAFWRLVEEGIVPDVIDHQAQARALGLIYPDSEKGSTTELPAELLDDDTIVVAAKAEIKRLEQQKAAAENRIKAAIGPHAIGFLPDGTSYSWPKINRKGYTVEPSSYRRLARKAPK